MIFDIVIIIMTDHDSIKIGQRFVYEGYNGTIRFIGTVEGTKDTWVGVEWDDTTRGKHNGSKNGKVYFKCESETGGSFLRPNKLDFGVTLWQALLERYGKSSAADETSVLVAGNSTIMLETVGMDKVQKQFEKLNELSLLGLRDQKISSVGNKELLRQNCGENLEQLDLSKNLVSNWLEIATIAEQLSYLHVLNLSDNVIEIPNDCEQFQASFVTLRTLILNNCKLTWSDVMKCMEMAPNIEELNLEKNKISVISIPDKSQFVKLKFLNISNNNIERWENIKDLEKLENLRTLFVMNCGLSDCEMSDESFPELGKISLSGNKFDDLNLLNELNKLAELQEVTFKNNPIGNKYTPETLREFVIAKVHSITMYNRSVVNHAERQGAEIDYLKSFGADWRSSGGHQDQNNNKPSAEFLRSHPRYMELIAKYGPPGDHELFKKSTALQSSLMSVNIIVPDRPDIGQITRKLPALMTVGRIKMLIGRLLNVTMDDYCLAYVSQYNEKLIIPMEPDAETLDGLSFESGDIIKVVHPNEIMRREYAFTRVRQTNEVSSH